MLEDVVVIVGAGHAGVHAAVRLAAWPGRVVVIDEQSGETYERPPLSKDFLKAEGQGDASIPPLRKEQFFADKSIERVHGRVESIDRRAHLVHIAGGRSIAYTKLILAPGSAPRALRIPGGSLTGVHLLKTRDDAVALRDALRPGRRVVIVGAGYIGLEVAAAAAVIGCETTVLEYADRVMSRVTSHPVSAFFERLHTEHGTRFVFGAEVTAISGDGHVESVMTCRRLVVPRRCRGRRYRRGAESPPRGGRRTRRA
ncbi:NAD(P)/FAD-dependent oxidoreductase [Gordonia humi]|uniref:NAD(P)/FAD-dependent oxidoreductase n=1 Tax=Gordonia humi TaxID=686429 RepID=UPI003607FF58